MNQRCQADGGGDFNTKSDVEGTQVEHTSVVIVASVLEFSLSRKSGRWTEVFV
jgi:hypothetical protein